MGIQRFVGIVVLYLDVVPISAAPGVDGVGNGDGPVRRGQDGGSARRGDVGSAVIGNLPGERVLPVTEPRRRCV